jgi:hypothetical protein
MILLLEVIKPEDYDEYKNKSLCDGMITKVTQFIFVSLDFRNHLMKFHRVAEEDLDNGIEKEIELTNKIPQF